MQVLPSHRLTAWKLRGTRGLGCTTHERECRAGALGWSHIWIYGPTAAEDTALIIGGNIPDASLLPIDWESPTGLTIELLDDRSGQVAHRFSVLSGGLGRSFIASGGAK